VGHCQQAASALRPPDALARAEAAEHHRRLTKPPGSLGRLEHVGIRLAGISGASPPPLPAPAVVAVFAADHGVVAEGVTPWPQDVTAQMVANICNGGAAINVLARHAGAQVLVVDVGVAASLGPAPGLLLRKVRSGTANIAVEPAMTFDEAGAALDIGAEVAARAVEDGARCLVTGDMGIGNTTASAAVIASFTGRTAGEVTGRGTGIDDPTFDRKVLVVETALGRAADDRALDADPVTILASVGGLEIAALAGFIIGGAAARVPVIVDGVIALAGLVVAARIAPGAVPFCFAGHRSTEPGASVVLAHLGLEPILDLNMRLGEGSGACLALPIVEAAAKVLRDMATFDAAGVSHKPEQSP
jgi:nicotinate-nucleotide--dimethylbenzimidazole phosphoribosyltransferase